MSIYKSDWVRFRGEKKRHQLSVDAPFKKILIIISSVPRTDMQYA